jgi:2-polyprenyl-6-methoxyphenol hydroxylase-like FAD-dependent oxidoreductase/heme-degrading monooxygenase HmoA
MNTTSLQATDSAVPSQRLFRTILRMRAREGCEQAFEEAWRAAADDISRVPGNLRQELIRDAGDARTFVITSDWSDAAALDGFGRSAARDRLTAALRDLRDSAERHTYEVLHTVTARGPRIRVVLTVTVADGKEESYERAYLKVAERVRGTPGHVREELLHEPGTGRYHLFAEWEDEDSFNAWVDNPAHMEQTAPMLPYLLEDFEREIYQIRVRPNESLQAEVIPAGAGAAPSGQQRRAETSTEVLIVGAGPVGLTAAIELARRGVACRIVDKHAEPSQQADKAIGIHCRTMEIWEDMGIVREAMDAGIWLQGQTVFVNGRRTHQVDWALPELTYAHLGLPQYETERILAARLAGLGVPVDRGRELVGFSQNAEGVTAQLRGPTGQGEIARAHYLVGCDGAHSAVRAGLGLAFEGGVGMFPQLFMLGDVELDWSMPDGHLLRFMHVVGDELKGMLVCVPLRGRGRYRVATLAPPKLQAKIGSGAVPPGFWQEYTPPTLADIQAAVDELAPAATTARNLRWSSIFRIKHGIVDRYRVGRIFVAGDAAHLHPPAGGQGMNTGIQDAWNLGWKLGLAVRAQASRALLDSYEAERRPAGKEIVDRAVRVAFTDEIDMEDEKKQFLTDMQMTLSYASSPLVGESHAGASALTGPGPGDRAPDVQALRRVGVGHPMRLFDLTRGTAHTLLLYADAATGEDQFQGLEELGSRVRDRWPDLINAYLVMSADVEAPAPIGLPTLRDTEGGFRAAYGVSGTAAYVVRPDGHVGFRSCPVVENGLHEHLARVFAT